MRLMKETGSECEVGMLLGLSDRISVTLFTEANNNEKKCLI